MRGPPWKPRGILTHAFILQRLPESRQFVLALPCEPAGCHSCWTSAGSGPSLTEDHTNALLLPRGERSHWKPEFSESQCSTVPTRLAGLAACFPGGKYFQC